MTSLTVDMLTPSLGVESEVGWKVRLDARASVRLCVSAACRPDGGRKMEREPYGSGPDGGRKMKGGPCPAAGIGCPESRFRNSLVLVYTFFF